MQFSAHDLRYNLEQCFPSFYAFLQQRAKRWLGPLSYDSVEVDQVVEHIIEQLTRLGLIGGKDNAPQTELERLSNAQFYAFLNRSIKNKAIDRLRKNRLPVSSVAELEGFGGMEDEKDPLDDTSISIWGNPPFATPEDAAMEAVSREVLRNRIKNCIRALANAPHQLQALEQEFEEIDADDLVKFMHKEFAAQLDDVVPAHLSQHKDHAHRKLRQCLQRSSAHLRVLIALRITEYAVRSTGTNESSVNVVQLMYTEHEKQDISEQEVIAALKYLVSRNFLEWNGEATIRLSSSQGKRIARFYEEED
ncbi:MAG TPA: hypothetical protein VF043_38815 [Ktedonobacteraceae bacterium]